MDINYPYNAIFGCNTLVKFAAVIHQSYLCMTLPSAGGVIIVFGNQEEARRCEDNASSANKSVHVIETPEDDTEAAISEDPEESRGVSPAEHTKKITFCEDVPDRMVVIGKGLEEAEEARLIQFLCNNQELFTWSSSDLRGVSRAVIEHTLEVNPMAKPVKQGQRTMSEERQKVAQAEVQKLLDAGIIREVQYTKWLANVVMVPKKNGKW